MVEIIEGRRKAFFPDSVEKYAFPAAGNRAGGIRTRGLLHPRQALYQAEPQPELIAHYFAYSRRRGKAESTGGEREDETSALCTAPKSGAVGSGRRTAVSLWRRPSQTKQTDKQLNYAAGRILLCRPPAAKDLRARNGCNQTDDGEERAHRRRWSRGRAGGVYDCCPRRRGSQSPDGAKDAKGFCEERIGRECSHWENGFAIGGLADS